jgi:periplasmic protein TonB
MAYADQQEMSSGRMIAIGVVALLHIGVGYALATGLAYDAAKQVFEDLKTFDVQEEKVVEPDKPPPPPEKLDIPPPPKVTAPPPVNVTPVISTNTQQVTITPSAPPAPPPPPPAPPAPPAAPPPPPPPPRLATPAVQKGGSISDEDYPPSSIRNEEAGTSAATFTIGTDGKVTTCNASGASPTLDAETCKLIIRRFRYKPAVDSSGSPISQTKTQRVTWRLPQ